jgi:hypothetical protein
VEIVKVDLPLMKVIPLRRAKTGQILENDIFGRNDQFIAESGTEIDDKLMKKFDNFNVRRVVIREHQDTWIPSDRRSDLPTEGRIISEKTLSDSLVGPVKSLFDKHPETSMKKLTDRLLETAQEDQREEWIEFLSSLRDKLNELIGDVESSRDQLPKLPETSRKRVETVLEGSVIDLGKDFLQLPGSDGQLRDYLSLFKKRDQLRLKLIDFLIDHLELVKRTEESHSPESDETWSLSASDISQLNVNVEVCFDELDPSTVDQLQEYWTSILYEQEKLVNKLRSMEGFEPLLNNLWEATKDEEIISHKVLLSIEEQKSELPDFVSELIDKRKALEKKLQSISDQQTSDAKSIDRSATSDSTEDGSSRTKTFRDHIDEFTRGNELDAVEGILNFLKRQDENTDNYAERLQELRETILKLIKLENELSGKLEKVTDSTENKNYLENVLEGNVELLSERLTTMNLDSSFVRKIKACSNGWQTVQYNFEEFMWDLQKNEDIDT